MKLNLHINEEMRNVAARLVSYLDFEIAEDGISVYAVQGERIGASLKDGVGTIYYKNKHHFFRELGVFIEHARKSDAFDVTEDAFFETIGVMLNASSHAVPSVDGAKKFMDQMAAMGYNMLMLYTEDTIELENYPYFGLYRGRYSKQELREMDDYAYAYGIEMIPCLELLGHMGSYLKWEEARPIKDTATVMQARNEKTLQLIDELVKTVSSCLRSKRIHIGMDEAHDTGRGAFLDKHGYVPRAQIFHEHMAELMKITNKYGLKPMMWSDMYFRINAEDGFQYYQKDLVISEETKKQIPQEIQMVYWHYGEEPGCDEYMIEKHLDMNREVMFAGGVWDWSGMFAENNYAYEATRFSLNACRKYGVKEVMMTSWDNAFIEASMLGFSMAAEMCYHKDPSEEHMRNRFAASLGGDYDAFFCMSNFNNKFGSEETYPDFNQRYFGRPLFWQDIMEGVFDAHLKERPMSEFYRENAQKMAQYHGKFEDLYRCAQTVFEYLAVKTQIAETLVDAYKAGDKNTLSTICYDLLPVVKQKITEIRSMHFKLWRRNSKIFGWANKEYLYAGMAARCDTAMLLLDEYLTGKTHRIEELDEPHLSKPLNAFYGCSGIATPIGSVAVN